ncbi:hypothetical protein [Burkholderia cenocepacia]|nr:hypothetical protein [Burkholderia cenocepacia]MBR8251682.1 hypothetical protein [Burkholderia cenocepacia]MBR8291947.1 hypothetical protein [Burkholderia cenocepacia]MBR8499337.1 hypothetical protein [Burkholderia cenocepacia]USB83310.1 hypothetical protein NBG98_23530 [Burkholderia cenocepacia]
MKKLEPIYNVYTFFEAGELMSVGIKRYYRQGSDKKKLEFLQARATLDFSVAERIPLATPMSREEYHARERMGQTLAIFEPLFAAVDAGYTPLFCVTPIVDGVPTIHVSVPLGPLDMSKLPDEVAGPGKMDDYLFKYADNDANTFNIPSLINDDYFNAIRLLFNNQHFISCLKLLMSFVDTIAYVEFGDRQARETPVFIDWLHTFADGELAGATPEELWEFRNSLLHMSNLESRKVAAGKVAKLTPYVGARDYPQSQDPLTKYFNISKLLTAIANAVQRWIVSYNEHPEKMVTFVQRYDRVVSDDRRAIIPTSSITTLREDAI